MLLRLVGEVRKYSHPRQERQAFLGARTCRSHRLPRAMAEGKTRLEATTGVEPVNGGFANLCLGPLGYVAARCCSPPSIASHWTVKTDAAHPTATAPTG